MPQRSLFLFVLLSLALPSFAAKPTAEQLEFFEKKVRPVLVEYCYKCHSAEAKKLKAGLYLDSRAGLIKGGDTGPSFDEKQPAKSLLLTAISYTDIELEMPPKGKLPAQHIDALTKWINMGAPWPDDGNSKVGPAKTFELQKRKNEHWSWRPAQKPTTPAVQNETWSRDTIDRFILAKLEAKQLTPAGEASRRQWIRRVTFDLIGLPPTIVEVNAFLADKSADAYEKVVDRLLASPHFGERWARHWMDLARYAESYGHEFDYNLPHAHHYRDYLIRAFNNDLPYNRFVMEQIAGDLVEPRYHPAEGFNEAKIGTGFWWFGEATHAPVDVRGDEADRIDNQIDVFSKSFLGLTIACARCHDHKFDAISTKDYYAMAGFLQSSRRTEAWLDPKQRIEQSAKQIAALRSEVDKQLAKRVSQPHDIDIKQIARFLLATKQALQAPRVRPQNAKDKGKDPLIISDAVVAQTAEDHKLQPDRLRHWVNAISAVGTKDMTHPLFTWVNLAGTSDAKITQARQQIALVLNGKAKQADAAEANAPLLASFDKGNLEGWMTTGWAFNNAVTKAGQWNGTAGEKQTLDAGVINGQVNGEKLRGTLRSPTFPLEHNQIAVRLKAKGVTARLIIDGYFMEPYNGLLFRGTRAHNIDTKGQFKWITFGGDTQRYKGHTAWIEILDEGNGYAIVDEVRMTNGGLPADRPSATAVNIANQNNVGSAKSLATAYAAQFKRVAERFQKQPDALSTDDARLVNWLIDHQLLATADVDLKTAAGKLDGLRNGLATPTPILAMTNGSPENEHVFIRGKHTNLGDEVPRRFIEAIDGKPITPKNSSGRLELARKVVDPSNPYTSRVIVNRLWHHLFGRGIVPTVDDFGVLGQRPTHPELLDYLASQFVADGWSIKRMLRRMVLTSTYRMDSRHQSEAMITRVKEVDPANTLLHKARLRRLQAEAIRDSVLTISGRLDRKLYGPSVPVHLTSFMEGRGRPRGGPLDGQGRRSLYIAIRRNFITPMLLAFDFPVPFNAMGRRTVSNVPAQALIMMNDPFIVQQSKLWAQRLLVDKEVKDTSQRVALMYEQAFARPPRDNETRNALDFLDTQAKALNVSPNDPRVWADLCHVMMNLKEFIYLP